MSRMMSDIPVVLDALNLMANVHVKAEIERLKNQIEELEKLIQVLLPEPKPRTLTNSQFHKKQKPTI